MKTQHQAPDHAPAFEQLQADLVRSINHYGCCPDAYTAGAIAMLLHRMLEHPLIELFPELRRQCAQGLNAWRVRSCVGETPPRHAASLH